MAALLLSLVLIMIASSSMGCGTDKTSDGSNENDENQGQASKLTWPTGYHDTRRTGRSDTNGPAASNVLWTFEAGAQSKSWAVLGKDGEVIAGFDGKVIVLNPADSSVVWQFSVGSSSASTCCVAGDGTIYTSAGSKVYALSPEGNEKWSYDMGSQADEPSLSPSGIAYVGSTGGKLVALSAEGKKEWEYQVNGNIRSPSMDKDGNLYCGASPLVLYALDKNGNQKWVFKPEGDLPSYQGQMDWTNTLDMPSIGDDGTIYMGSYVMPGFTTTGQQIPGYAIPQQAKIYAVSANGTKKWEYYHPESKMTIHTPSIGRDGTLYAGTSAYRVIALKPDGTTLWEFKTGDSTGLCPSVYSPSIGKDGLLYAATTCARMICINPDGTEKWRYSTENAWLPGNRGSNNFTPPPIAEDGTLFSVLAQGRIYAFRVKTSK